MLGVCLTLLILCAGISPAPAQAVRQLTRDEARQEAAAKNLGLLLARKDRQRAERLAVTSHRPYVPILTADTTWSDDTSLLVSGERNRSLRYGVGAQWELAQGTQLDARLGATEFFSGQSFVPTPATALTFGVVQPLLRGFGPQANLLAQADMQVQLQRALFIQQLNDFLVDVDLAYWNLAYAQADLSIKERSRDRAQTQFEETQENIRRDLLAESEIYVVEDNLVRFEQQLLASRESLELAQARLARLMRAEPRTSLVATDALEQQSSMGALDWERDVERSLRHNPEVIFQEVVRAQAREQVEFDRNQIRPRLDAIGGATLNGVGDSRAQSWGEVATARNPDYAVGLRFELPLDRAPDYARVEQAEIALQRAETALLNSQDRVRYDLRELSVQVERRTQILALTARQVELSELKLETEREKYRSGLSTLVNVVQFQRELDNARIARQRALLDLVILRTRIANTSGLLYEQAGLEVR